MNVLQGFGLFFLLGGLVGVWGGVERILRERAQVRRVVHVNARIVGVESDGIAEDTNVTWYFPVVTYTVEGKSIRVKLPKGTVRRDDHRVGGTIEVYYDPLDPTQAAARLRDYPGGWAATTLAAVFVAIGAGLCWAGWNGGRRGARGQPGLLYRGPVPAAVAAGRGSHPCGRGRSAGGGRPCRAVAGG